MADISRREKDRETRKAEIIDAAERVFLRKGFEGASMDEIAKEALFTKRTVYQYFVNKDDLFFAVVLRLRKQLFDCIQSALAAGSSGREKLHLAAQAYYGFYKQSSNVLGLIDQTGYDGDRAATSPHYQELMRFAPYMFGEFAKAVGAGQADGTIRSDLSTLTAASAIAFALTGFFRQLAETSGTFTRTLGLSEAEFVETTLTLLDDALRPQKENNPGEPGLS